MRQPYGWQCQLAGSCHCQTMLLNRTSSYLSKRLSPVLYVSFFFPASVIEYPDNSNLREKVFILDQSSKAQSIMGKSRFETAAHILFPIGKQRAMMKVELSSLSPFRRILCPGSGPLHKKADLLTSLKGKIIPYSMPRGPYLPDDSLFYQLAINSYILSACLTTQLAANQK